MLSPLAGGQLGPLAQSKVRVSAEFWTNLTNVTVTGDLGLHKTIAGSAWDSGARTVKSLSGDGYAESIFTAPQGNRILALGSGTFAVAFPQTPYLVYVNSPGDCYYIENGVTKWTANVGADPKVRLDVTSGVLRVYAADVLRYTSALVMPSGMWAGAFTYSSSQDCPPVTLGGAWS